MLLTTKHSWWPMTITRISVLRARLSRSRLKREWWGTHGRGRSLPCPLSARQRPGIPTWTPSTGEGVGPPWWLADRRKLQVCLLWQFCIRGVLPMVFVQWFTYMPMNCTSGYLYRGLSYVSVRLLSQRWRHGWTIWCLMRGRGWSTWKRWKPRRPNRAAIRREPWSNDFPCLTWHIWNWIRLRFRC